MSNSFSRWLSIVAISSLSLLSITHAESPVYLLNERIEVNTMGSWDKATIIEVGTAAHAGEFKVHYEGWASSYDRWLSPTCFRKATDAATPAAPTPQVLSAKYQINEHIEVNTLGSWDKATIIAVGTGEHEHEFKVHYEGYSSSFDRWLLPTYFRKISTNTTATKAVTTSTPTGQSSVEPRLGKYNINSYGVVGSPPLYLGHIELQAGGKYRISHVSSGGYYGNGTYAFNPADSNVQWLSGPCKDSGWNGAFTVEREGETHKIRLRSGTIASNSTD